jgi:hypothetical protein
VSPLVHRIVGPLLRSMDGKVRAAVIRRIDAMERELAFLSSREDRRLATVRRFGWTDDRLQVLFALNSVYQQLLGPLQSAARGGPEGLGDTVPVRHGTSTFSRATTTRIQLTMRDFNALVDALELRRTWLQENTCGDVLFAISRDAETE